MSRKQKTETKLLLELVDSINKEAIMVGSLNPFNPYRQRFNLGYLGAEKAWGSAKAIGKGLSKVGPLNILFFGPGAWSSASKLHKAFGPTPRQLARYGSSKIW